MLWFGSRPDPSANMAWEADEHGAVDDAAAEIEVASTGRRGVPAVEPVPHPEASVRGSQQVDDALAALDALAHRRPVPAPSPHRPAPASAAAPPPNAPPPSTAAPAPGTPDADSPASRAYQRLRRIFPG
jgi:hypothetical protein